MALASAVPRRTPTRTRPGAVGLALGPLSLAVAAIASVARPVDEGVGPAAWTTAAALLALVVGVPHGAVDHLALAQTAPRRRRRVVAAAYVAVAAVGTALVLLAPAPAFVGVVALSVRHFGTGDLAALDESRLLPPLPRGDRALLALALGAVPVLLPLTSGAGARTLAALQPDLAALTHPATAGVLRALTLLVALASVVRLVVAGRRSGQHAIRPATELVVLVIGSLVLPPLLAFALYFALWHAARHTLRLATDENGVLDRGLARRVLRDGAPSSVVALVVVATLALSGTPAPAALWLALAVVWGLTVPHALVVTAFDRRRAALRRAGQSEGSG